jgi:hypothetical protein
MKSGRPGLLDDDVHHRVEQRHVGVGPEGRKWWAWRASSVRRGSITTSRVPRAHRVLDPGGGHRVVCVGLAPMTITTSACAHVAHRVADRARADALQQRRHAGGMAQPRAVVDVVAAETQCAPASGTGRPLRCCPWPSRSRPARGRRAGRGCGAACRRRAPAPRPSWPRGRASRQPGRAATGRALGRIGAADQRHRQRCGWRA